MFKNLDIEKQNKILDAAFAEFGEHGFTKASTNRVVKAAGIGKGMLFYYFNSKSELFDYLIEYGINYMTTEFFSQLDVSETDFIERYKQAGVVKMKAYSERPEIFNFFGNLYLNTPKDLSKVQVKKLEDLRQLAYSKLYINIDTSLFRDDIPIEMIYKIIYWSMEGYEKELTNELQGKNLATVSLDPNWDDFFSFLDKLKILVYK